MQRKSFQCSLQSLFQLPAAPGGIVVPGKAHTLLTLPKLPQNRAIAGQVERSSFTTSQNEASVASLPQASFLRAIVDVMFVGWLLNVPATCECISGTDLHRQFYVLPH